MTISFNLGFNPKWYFADLVGRPLGGGFMATFRSLNPAQQKLVFQDPAGLFPYPYVPIPNQAITGISIDENGTQGPFYFEFDTTNPQELYFLAIYDADGVLQWTINNYSPGSGGGGGIITTNVDLNNLIVNNVMYRNIGQTPNPIPNLVTFLAPGPFASLASTPSNAGPDILFIKNNLNATDQITFIPFPLGDSSLSPDVTPVDSFNYVCGNSPSAETQKCVQFPITGKVQNLSNQTVTFTVWAKGSTNATLTLFVYQFFGDGGGSSSAPVQAAVFNLTSVWAQYKVTYAIPDVTGKVTGACGNDGLFLQVGMPLGVPCNVSFTKPAGYLGNIALTQEFISYDEIDGVIDSPRTGDIIPSMNYSGSNFVPGGWVLMNDGTIGDATSNATSRANIDTFPLFNMLWNGTSNTSLQLFNSAGTPIGRGASSIIDFVANNAISIPKSMGRIFAGIGTAGTNSIPVTGGSNSGISWPLAATTGNELHTQAANEVGPHAHTVNIPTNDVNAIPGAGSIFESANGANLAVAVATQINTPNSVPFFVEQPTTFVNYLIKL